MDILMPGMNRETTSWCKKSAWSDAEQQRRFCGDQQPIRVGAEPSGERMPRYLRVVGWTALVWIAVIGAIITLLVETRGPPI